MGDIEHNKPPVGHRCIEPGCPGGGFYSSYCHSRGHAVEIIEFVPAEQLRGAVSLDELRAIHYDLMAPFSPSDHVPGNVEDAVTKIEDLMNRLAGGGRTVTLNQAQADVFARNLNALKEREGCSWLDIAHAIGHRRDRYVMKLASGERVPQQRTVEGIAHYFGVTAESMTQEGSHAS